MKIINLTLTSYINQLTYLLQLSTKLTRSCYHFDKMHKKLLLYVVRTKILKFHNIKIINLSFLINQLLNRLHEMSNASVKLLSFLTLKSVYSRQLIGLHQITVPSGRMFYVQKLN